jgi:hypothetical protein
MCTERRREFLKSVELLGNWMPICYACASRAAKLAPMPQTIGAIRKALQRDRRQLDRRRGARDTRVFQHNRRSDERRAPRAAEIPVDDDMIMEILDLAARIESSEDDLTRIVDARLIESRL